jgi:tetratricopeptide (TPR) repeat protein
MKLVAFAVLAALLCGCPPAKQNDLELAEQLYAAQRYTDAARSYEAAHGQGQGNRDTHLRLARAYQKSGQPDRALVELKRLLATSPSHQVAVMAVEIALQLGDAPTALAALRKALELEPNDARSLNNFGFLLMNHERRYDVALRAFQRALEVAPRFADPYFNLGVLHSEYLPDRGKAGFYFQKYLELQPSGGQAQQVRATLEKWALEGAAGAAPASSSAEGFLLAGRDKLSRADFAGAAAEFEAATRAAPEQVDAHLLLGQARIELGEGAAAVAALETARKLAPGHVDVLYQLGWAYKLVGQDQRAVAVWREALKLKPDDRRVLTALQRAGAPSSR